MEKVNIMLGMFVGVLLILSVLIIFTNIANSEDLTSLNTKEHITIIKEDTPDFLKEDFNSEYGVIEISKSDSTKLADYSLTKIDESIIDVVVYGKAILYSDGKLFDDKKFKDIKNNLIELDYSQYYIYKNVSYEDQEVATYKEICSTPITEKGNITSEKEVCYSVPNTYKNVTKSKMEWIEYDYEILKSGNYEWKMEAKRPINKQVDFIPVAQEKELNEWVWWNNAWNSKKEIKVKENSGGTLNNYTTLINIPYATGMQVDFDDLRFVNSTEDGELKYWIENKTDSTSANVWIEITTLTANVNTTIYMYYNNPDVSTTGSKANAFANALNESNGKTFSSSDTASTYANSRGFLMTSQKKILLLGIYNTNSGVTCNTYGYWEGSTNSFNYSISGGNAQTMKMIPASTNFYLLPFTAGTTCTSKYANFGGYPLTQTNIKWTNGDAFYSGAHHTDTNGFNVGSLWTDERASSEPTYYIGTAIAQTCTFSGYVKDSAGGGLDEAEVVIFNQNNKNEIYNTTTDENGYWSKDIVNSTSNFVAVAYYNNTLVGSAKPFISGTC
jgi:hypothetical protein